MTKLSPHFRCVKCSPIQVFRGAYNYSLAFFRPTIVYEADDDQPDPDVLLEIGYVCVPLPATLNDDRICVVVDEEEQR